MKPSLLIVSHVLPFPGATGQEQRVLQMVRALSKQFRTTFLTVATEPAPVKMALEKYCDEALVLQSAYPRDFFGKLLHKMAAGTYAAINGVKTSNYTIGRLELSADRVMPALEGRHFDCALFEYWHAAQLVPALKAKGMRCILDMHNVLWRARQAEFEGGVATRWVTRVQVDRYRQYEEHTWRQFDGVIAISAAERDYVTSRVTARTEVFYAPMGVDSTAWPYEWQPVTPPRVVYYGALGNAHNQEGVLRCARQILPQVWREIPNAEFWIVGSNPPPDIQNLQVDKRIRITGFVERPQAELPAMSVALCPFRGRFGFRSRLVELMLMGIPVVANSDAVYGMRLTEQEALLTGESDEELAAHVMKLLREPAFAKQLSLRARQVVEQDYSMAATYGDLGHRLSAWASPPRTRGAKSEILSPPTVQKNAAAYK
ncbi:MAG: glycosyltransferase family 4 protein [Acidobacteriota bacterium]